MIDVNEAGASVTPSFNVATLGGVQQALPKIIAEWKNSKSLDNVSVSVNTEEQYSTAQQREGEIGDYFDVRQVANGWNRQAHTWGVADDKDVDGLPIRADGTWHALPEKNKGVLEFGWRAKTVSNSSGVYTTTPVITMTFDQEKINYIDIYTSEYSGAVKEYTLQYQDSSGSYQNVVSNHVLPKGTYTYRHTLNSGDTLDIKGVKLTIHKTQNGIDHARINEINPVYETDISDKVVSCSIEKNREIHDTTLPLGGIAANSFNMELDNSDHSFTINNNKLYGGYVNKDIKFTVSMGWRISENPDVFEYINCGTYWADEWKQSSNMTMGVRSRDFTRFLMDAVVDGGFLVENSDAGAALRMLVSQKNFPRADFQALYPYQKAVREDGAVAHYRFSEGVGSGVASGDSAIVPANGLVTRWWALQAVSELAVDLQRAQNPNTLVFQTGISGLVGRELIDYNKSPTLTENSLDNPVTSGNALDFGDRTIGGQADYYHAVFDGFFIPPSTGNYLFRVTVANGGFRLYLGGASSKYVYSSTHGSETLRRDLEFHKGRLVLDHFFDSSTSYVTGSEYLYAGQPVPIRMEAFHVSGTFDLKLEKSTDGGTTYSAVAEAETTTDVAFDVIGGRDDQLTSIPGTGGTFSSQIRNHGTYSGDPILRKPGNLTSDRTDHAVQFDNTSGDPDYVTIPYDLSIDMTNSTSDNYTGEFSLEAYVQFTAAVEGQGVYAGNMDSATSGTGTKGVGLYWKSSSRGIKFINSSGTMHQASVTAAGATGAWVHVVATYDGTDLKYYEDGVLKDTSTSVGAPAAWTDRDFLLGKHVFGASTIRYFRGFFDEFAIYKKALTAEQVRDHYYITTMSELRIHPYLFGDQNAFEIAGQIATGDLGMFYFDEFGKFRYDHFYRLHEANIPDHAVSQATLSDSTNIESAERRIELLANKVTVVINPTIKKNIGISSLWRAPSPSTVTVTKLVAQLSASATEMEVSNISDPPWPTTGYCRIDSEIIKYDSTVSGRLLELTRAQFGTDAAIHLLNAIVRETKFYQFGWAQTPAVDIRDPFIAAIVYEKSNLVSVDRFIKKPYAGEIVISATEAVPITSNSGEIVFLEGQNPYTGMDYYTSISGRAISDAGATAEVNSQSASYSDSIRKYGLKEIKIDNRFFSDEEYAQRIADFLISKMENGSPILDIDVISMPRLQLGDRVTISQLEQLGISNRDYWVIESKMDYTGGVKQKLTLREVS
tara:strand:- start:706 stop:4392 length:3687 start_codon:yes stop_codon:yes gene_type:complete